jgi:hypothetical protein
MTTVEGVVDSNSRLGALGEFAKVVGASRLPSARQVDIRVNKLPKSAISGVCGNVFGN